MSHTVVDFICDATQAAAIDAVWAHQARAEGVTRVRCALQADAAGHINWPLVAQGAAAWHSAGVAVDLVCAYEYLPPFADEHGLLHWPNEPVGIGTHRLTTPYTERFRSGLEQHLPSVLKAGVDGVYILNEPQVWLTLAGDNCPSGTRLKRDATGNLLNAAGAIVPWRQAERIPAPTLNRSCMAPEEYATIVWQTCQSLEHIGCPRRIAGSLSVLPQTGLNLPVTASMDDRLDVLLAAHNPYLVGFMLRWYAHLASCGVTPNHTHLSLNMEGYWTIQTAQRVHDTLRAVMDAHGDHAQLIVGEAGVRNHGADMDRLLTSLLALEAVFGVGNVAYFSRPGLVPFLGPILAYLEYGYAQWFQQGHTFTLGAEYPIGPTVRRWLFT